MPIIALIPIPLPSLKSVMKRFSYECVIDDYPVLQFEKDGSSPTGYEAAAQYWPQVITFRHPDYISDRYPNQLVYDSSEIVDLLSDFIVATAPSTTRTEVSMTLKAILKPRIVE
jgi:hypothetical protein